MFLAFGENNHPFSVTPSQYQFTLLILGLLGHLLSVAHIYKSQLIRWLDNKFIGPLRDILCRAVLTRISSLLQRFSEPHVLTESSPSEAGLDMKMDPTNRKPSQPQGLSPLARLILTVFRTTLTLMSRF